MAQNDHISDIPVTWGERQIRELLRRRHFDYQKIDLPFGLSTAGSDRSSSFNMIFPSDLAGKTVLDLGCNHGFFCFEALRRGAERVVGYDVRTNAIKGAKILARCLGAKAEFAVRDFDREPPTEHFDYVLCLNVLHHLRNPLTMIDRIVDIANEIVAIEVAVPGLFELLDLKIEPVQWPKLRRAPVIYIDSRGKYLMTPFAARALLRKHACLSEVRAFRSGFKDRYMITAKKRPRPTFST